mmetsp:Transcript_18976/g.48392  ORF Transcript_18976/g.48392 Transcript_18976/m.48392 type:complete len:217 (+) Transcript_18976:1613-2263(+)
MPLPCFSCTTLPRPLSPTLRFGSCLLLSSSFPSCLVLFSYPLLFTSKWTALARSALFRREREVDERSPFRLCPPFSLLFCCSYLTLAPSPSLALLIRTSSSLPRLVMALSSCPAPPPPKCLCFCATTSWKRSTLMAPFSISKRAARWRGSVGSKVVCVAARRRLPFFSASSRMASSLPMPGEPTAGVVLLGLRSYTSSDRTFFSLDRIEMKSARAC